MLTFQHILGRARGQGAAGLHQHNPVTEARGERQIVQRHHDGAARRGKGGKVVEQGELVGGIEAGGGLVGQQRARLLRQRARNQHAGVFAARHLEHGPLRQMADVHGGEGALDGRAVGGALAVPPSADRASGRAPRRRGRVSAQCDGALLRQVGERAGAAPAAASRRSARPSSEAMPAAGVKQARQEP